MSSDTPRTNKFDMLSDEVKNLYVMENWGTTLFITAIALCVKQLVDWGIGSSEKGSKPLILDAVAYTFPALIGIAGFIFQRCINYGIRRTRTFMYLLVDEQGPEKPFRSLGLIGWFIGSLPISAGMAGTWHFSLLYPEVKAYLPPLFLASIFLIMVAFGVFIGQNQEIRRLRSTRQTP